MTTALRRFGLLIFTGSILASPSLHAEGEHHWSYSGETGPGKWAALESDYSACGIGKMQSPIDIRDSVAKKGDSARHRVRLQTVAAQDRR